MGIFGGRVTPKSRLIRRAPRKGRQKTGRLDVMNGVIPAWTLYKKKKNEVQKEVRRRRLKAMFVGGDRGD